MGHRQLRSMGCKPIKRPVGESSIPRGEPELPVDDLIGPQFAEVNRLLSTL